MQALRKFWSLWKRFGLFIGNIVGRLVLSLFYFTVFVPFGLGVRLFGDPLGIRNRVQAGWKERATRDLSLDDGRRMS
jgi:hypothetical protein